MRADTENGEDERLARWRVADWDSNHYGKGANVVNAARMASGIVIAEVQRSTGRLGGGSVHRGGRGRAGERAMRSSRRSRSAGMVDVR